MFRSRKHIAFGWNASVWNNPFQRAVRFVAARGGVSGKTILEIGCGEASNVALLFDDGTNRIELSAHTKAKVQRLTVVVEEMRARGQVTPNVVCRRKDATALDGTYDLIILKSVLGGLFRDGATTVAEVNAYLAQIAARNLNEGGHIITCDNGVSLFEPLLRRRGARRGQWRFFRPGDLSVATVQFQFGCLSAFSLSSRIGMVGKLVEEAVLYPFDLLLSPLFRRFSTVIISVIPKLPGDR